MYLYVVNAHIDTFARLLKSDGWEVHGAARGVGGITDEDLRNIAEGLQYLKEHPETLEEDWFSRVYGDAGGQDAPNDQSHH